MIILFTFKGGALTRHHSTRPFAGDHSLHYSNW